MTWLDAVNPAVLPWLALAYKTRDLYRDPRNPALRALCFAFFALGVGLTVLISPVYGWIDGVTGVPHLARLLSHSFGLLNGCGIQVLLLHLAYPQAEANRRTRARYGTLVVALAAMATLFLTAPIDREDLDFTTTYAGAPLVVAYMLVYLPYLGYSLYDIGRLAGRYSHQARSQYLRHGLRLIAVGSGVALFYPVAKAAYVGARWLDVKVDDFEAPVSAVLIAISVLLVVTGLTLPGWGPRLARTGVAVRHRQLHRAIRPLWRALTDAIPEIALAPPPIIRAEQRLYRRVIEIQDGLLALRPYHDPAITDTAHAVARQDGLSTTALHDLTDAAAITVALGRKCRNEPTGNQAPVTAAPPADDLVSEARWLARISRAYSASPLVNSIAKAHADDPERRVTDAGANR